MLKNIYHPNSSDATHFHLISSHKLFTNPVENLYLYDNDYRKSYYFTFSRLNEPINFQASYFIVTDELCTSNIPFYFPRNKRVALLYESPIYTNKIDAHLLRSRFNLILTHQKKLLQLGSPFFELNYSSNLLTFDVNDESYKAIDYQDKKHNLVSCIANIEHDLNIPGYGFRKQVIENILESEIVDCYGKGIKWIDSKLEALESYCFSIAMENIIEDYYFTEKLIDCFLTSTVPVYYGCPAVSTIFDPRGIKFFTTYQELNTIIDSLSFAEYQRLMPFIIHNKEVCIDLLLDSFKSFLIRCARSIIVNKELHPENRYPLFLQSSKLLSLLRRYILDW